MLKTTVIISSVIFILSGAYASEDTYSEKIKNSLIARKIPIKCKADHYVWAGMLKEGEQDHLVEVKKSKNSTPLEINILEKKNGKLFVDNDEFKVIKSNPNETIAIYVDDKNIITIVINYKYGTALYSKVFSNFDFGKQNTLSFVGNCLNN